MKFGIQADAQISTHLVITFGQSWRTPHKWPLATYFVLSPPLTSVKVQLVLPEEAGVFLVSCSSRLDPKTATARRR